MSPQKADQNHLSHSSSDVVHCHADLYGPLVQWGTFFITDASPSLMRDILSVIKVVSFPTMVFGP